MMRRIAAAMVFAAIAATLPAQVPTTGTRQVLIRVQSEVDATPVEYSIVAMPALGLERFADVSGRVLMPVPRAGPVRIVVKRLGFIPRDTTIVVTEAPTQEFRVSLARLAFRLEDVRVTGSPGCQEPGAPSPEHDPVGSAVVEQLRQNAERFALLTKAYPFIYLSERAFSEQHGDSAEVADFTDTIVVAGVPDWTYRPGTVVRRRSGVSYTPGGRYSMRLPSLRDLGERAFIGSHCFHVAGVEDKAGQRLLRMDIAASERLRSPDVDGAVWLDTVDFRLRFARFELTRVPAALRDLKRVTTEVTYLDVIPFVPLMYFTTGENLVVRPKAPRLRLLERQQVIDVRFVGARPDSATPGLPPAVRPPSW